VEDGPERGRARNDQNGGDTDFTPASFNTAQIGSTPNRFLFASM
jgi:hypothetical protein